MDIINDPIVYLHAAEKVDDQIVDIFKNYSNGNDSVSIEEATGNFGLPPSSIERYLDETYGGRSDLRHVMITDFNQKYKSKFTNSMYNDNNKFGFSEDFCKSPDNKNEAQSFAKLTATLAKSVLQIILGQSLSQEIIGTFNRLIFDGSLKIVQIVFQRH